MDSPEARPNCACESPTQASALTPAGDPLDQHFKQSVEERLTELQGYIVGEFQRVVYHREAELHETISQLRNELRHHRPIASMASSDERCSQVQSVQSRIGPWRQPPPLSGPDDEVFDPEHRRFASKTRAIAGCSSEKTECRSVVSQGYPVAVASTVERMASTEVVRKPSAEQAGQLRRFFMDPGRSMSRATVHRGRHMCLLDESGLAPDRYVIAPNSRFRVMFELSSVLALGYDAVMTPWIVAWSPQNTSYEVVSILTLCFWTLDMLLNFFTGYYAEGEVVLQHRVIALNYLKTWFLADLLINSVDLTTLCMELYFQDHANHRFATYIRAAPFLMRVLRLMKVSKLLRIVVFFRRIHERAPGPVASRLAFMGLGTKLASTLLWLNHVICCMWYFIGTRHDMSDTGYSWLDIQLRTGDMTYREAGEVYQYFTSLHWAITQMTPGSMSVVPQNSLERLFNVCCLLVGLFVGALLVSQLSARMVKMQLENQEQTVRMSKLHAYLKENRIGWGLRTRVQHQIAERLDLQKRLTAKDVPLLQSLSTSLRKELCFASFAHHLMTHTLFHAWGTMDRKLVEALCFHAVELLILSKDDDLFTPQTPADRVYNVLNGTLRYASDDNTMVMSYRSESNLDDEVQENQKVVRSGQWISEACLWLEWTYAGTLTSVEQCELLVLSVLPTLDLLRKHTKVKTLNHHYARAAQRVVVEIGNAYDQLDIQVDTESVLMNLPLEWRLMVMEPLVHSAFNERNKAIMTWSRLTGDMEPLLAELRKGKSILTLQKGSLERTVPLVVLNIRKRGAVDTLVQLAKGTQGKLTVAPQLPGTKLRTGESPETAMNRLLQKLFPKFLDYVQVNRTVSCCESRESATYKILSKYTIYKFDGTFGLPGDYLGLWSMARSNSDINNLGSGAGGAGVPTPAMGRQKSSGAFRLPHVFTRRRSYAGDESALLGALDNSDTFLMSSGNGELNLYAWLSDADFTNLKLPKGLEVLRSWVSSNEGEFMVLDHEEGVVDPSEQRPWKAKISL